MIGLWCSWGDARPSIIHASVKVSAMTVLSLKQFPSTIYIQAQEPRLSTIFACQPHVGTAMLR
eukprot:5821438-Amphidinium_carterae.1